MSSLEVKEAKKMQRKIRKPYIHKIDKRKTYTYKENKIK